jgi:hypothetical protein
MVDQAGRSPPVSSCSPLSAVHLAPHGIERRPCPPATDDEGRAGNGQLRQHRDQFRVAGDRADGVPYEGEPAREGSWRALQCQDLVAQGIRHPFVHFAAARYRPIHTGTDGIAHRKP